MGVPPSDPPAPLPDEPADATESPSPVVLDAKAPATTRSITSIMRGSVLDREELPPPPSEPPVSEPIVVKDAAPEVLPEPERAPILPEAVAVVAPEPIAEAVVAEPEPEPAPEPVPVPEVVVAPPEPVPEAVAAPEPAPVAETVVAAPEVAPAPEPVRLEPVKPNLTETIVHGSSEAEKIASVARASSATAEAEAPKVKFAKTLAFGSKINELPQSERVELPKERSHDERRDARERLKEKRALAQDAQKAVSPKEEPDEISVPPANDLHVEEEHEHFFSSAELAVRKSVHEIEQLARQEEEDAVPEKARRKLHPHVVRRRERFAGYVKIAVASAAIVCLAAVGRSAMHARSAQAPASTQAVVEAPAVVADKAAEKPAEKAAEKPAEKAAEPVAAAAPEPPKEAAPEPTPEPAAAPAVPAKAEEIAGDAKEELKKSRTALEKRKIPEAIEAGERSVTLDPTDGEAWLILGAAYQEKGDMVNARRCYSSCVKEGKTGPRLECQKMLRF